MEWYVEKIREWMIRDKLMINDSKTEFILIGTRQQLVIVMGPSGVQFRE